MLESSDPDRGTSCPASGCGVCRALSSREKSSGPREHLDCRFTCDYPGWACASTSAVGRSLELLPACRVIPASIGLWNNTRSGPAVPAEGPTARPRGGAYLTDTPEKHRLNCGTLRGSWLRARNARGQILDLVHRDFNDLAQNIRRTPSWIPRFELGRTA